MYSIEFSRTLPRVSCLANLNLNSKQILNFALLIDLNGKLYFGNLVTDCYKVFRLEQDALFKEDL